MANFTFRKHRNQGMGEMAGGDVRLNGKVCGWYQECHELDRRSGEWELWLSIEDANTECGWRNARLKQRFQSEAEVRTWLQGNGDAIQAKFKLHFTEE